MNINIYKIIKMRNILITYFLECVQGPQNVIFWFAPCKPKWIERNKYETLSSSSKKFGSHLAPRPLCMFFSDPKLFRLVLKSRICFLSIHFGLQGLSKIIFWVPWTYSKINSPCKLRNLVALWGLKSKKNGYLRIQGSMQIFSIFIVNRIFECLIDELLAIW